MIRLLYNEKRFDKWIKLRKKFKDVIRNKEYKTVIKYGEKLLIFAANAKFIGIMTALFYKETGHAYLA